MSAMRRVVPFVLFGGVAAVVVAAVAWALLAARELPDGPVAIVWDKAACAACGMHVGEPGFAAQLTDTTGHTLAFDDPGCLFEYVAQNRPTVHAIWFHHRHETRWLAADRAAFVDAPTTPMGFGIAAVDAGTAGAMTLDAARQRCLARAPIGGR